MKKAMKKIMMRKVLSCLVVIAILMSAMPVSAVAQGDRQIIQEEKNHKKSRPSKNYNKS